MPVFPEPMPAPNAATGTLVLDTNVVLDLWVFQNGHIASLVAALQTPTWRCIGSAAMRDELEHVLAYAHIAARLTRIAATAAQVLLQYDAHVKTVLSAPRAQAICKDPDDQKFIDLAVEHGAMLLSQDKAVLTLRKRLARLGVRVLTAQQFTP